MSSHSLADISQSKWINACRKLGLVIETNSGKGSHVLIVNPKTQAKYTLQHNLHKFINIKIFKKLISWGFTDEQIWENLR